MTTCSRADAGADSNYPFLTQKERDNETGLDFFKARYYSSAMGRFTSTDPVMVTPYRLFNPQGLNAYSYCRNNPLKFTDPDGEEVRFKNEHEAKKQVERIRAGLSKDQRDAVNYKKTKDGRIILTVDAKAAGKAGKESLLGRLNNAATSSLVGRLEFVKQNEKFTQVKFGVKGQTSLAEAGEEASDDEDAANDFNGLTLFENTFDRKKKIYFQQVGLNSDTPGVTRMLISSEQSVESMTQAIFHETLAHFENGIKGDANGRLTGKNAVHPLINDDADRIKNAVQVNLRQKK